MMPRAMRFSVLAELKRNCETIMGMSGWLENVRWRLVLQFLRRERSPLLSEERCVSDCRKQRNVEEEKEKEGSVVLGAGAK